MQFLSHSHFNQLLVRFERDIAGMSVKSGNCKQRFSEHLHRSCKQKKCVNTLKSRTIRTEIAAGLHRI